MDREGRGFAFLQQKFHRISFEELKAGIFDGPQIRELMKDSMFDDALSAAELSAWRSLKSVITNFLGNNRSAELREGSRQTPEELWKVMGSHVSQNALSTVPLRQFPSALWRLQWGTGRAIPPGHSCHGRTLPRPVGCELSCGLPLVFQTRCGGNSAQEKIIEKTLHPWLAFG